MAACPATSPLRIVIVGGGFAGTSCARRLGRRLRRQLRTGAAEVTLFDRENHMVFTPLLAEVAGAALDPEVVAVPLRQMLPGVRCRTETVENIDHAGRAVIFRRHDGGIDRLPYDQLVLACGGATHFGRVPGMADHAMPLRTVGDALALRAHVAHQMERAEVCGDVADRRFALSFLVVGGGFSGVEVAGEINDLVRSSLRFYRNLRPDDVSVTIVHSRDELLPEVSPSLRRFTGRKMQRAGVRLALGQRVACVTGQGVRLADGTMLAGGTVVGTVGNGPGQLVERLPWPKDHGRLHTEADMRIPGQPRIWAIGDCALVANAATGQPAPTTGQFADRMGRRCADNLLRTVAGRPTRPFAFRPLGQLCAIGSRQAVAELCGLRISGVLAWWLWRTVYLLKMPSWSRRVKVALDWTWDLFFARDLAHLRPDRTERVARAFFPAGDHVFQQGDPSTSFYVIEAGEAEVVRDGAVLAQLGPGEFFGEMGLMAQRPRRSAVRARTDLEVTVMGRQAFEQLTDALAALRRTIAAAIQRRTDFWERLPGAREALDALPLAALTEPLGNRAIAPDTDWATVRQRLQQHDMLCVVDADGDLLGTLTRHDLVAALERLAAATSRNTDLPRADQLMNPAPRTVDIDRTSSLALTMLREREVDAAPVLAPGSRRPVGVIPIGALMEPALQAVAERMARRDAAAPVG